MVFTSKIFLYVFLPTFLAGYYLIRREYRNHWLLFASYVFYAWTAPVYIVLILTSTVIDFVAVKGMVKMPERKRLFALASICSNLGMLGFFKYYNFFVDTINPLFDFLSIGGFPVLHILLPVGISFYTFQSLSYTIDVYRGRAQPADSLVDFATYVAMFPQLVAGPIVRYTDIDQQLKTRTVDWSKFSLGVWMFMAGFVKKVLIANQVGMLADKAFAMEAPHFFDAWIGIIGYSLQIYFDFSGYSDMAIGLGLMLGFQLPVNFFSPYKAISITDFWRRWHITLSTWFREFVYIPLGGNRGSQERTLFNLVATFFLSGLWHGAASQFVVWGLFHGAFLLIERVYRKATWPGKLPRAVRIAAVFLIVMMGWILFRAEGVGAAFEFYLALFGANGDAGFVLHPALNRFGYLMLIAGLVIAFFLPNTNQISERLKPWHLWTMFLLFIWACIELQDQAYNPFLYFQF